MAVSIVLVPAMGTVVPLPSLAIVRTAVLCANSACKLAGAPFAPVSVTVVLVAFLLAIVPTPSNVQFTKCQFVPGVAEIEVATNALTLLVVPNTGEVVPVPIFEIVRLL